MKQETVSFPTGLKQQAQEAAKNNHISFAAFVRQAVAEKLRRQEVSDNRRPVGQEVNQHAVN